MKPTRDGSSSSAPEAFPPGRLTLPRPVRDAEREVLRARRVAAGLPTDGPTMGLALSGGGIRSATFALGVLQALVKRGVLPWVDYLATVSGGGYVGTCLTTLLAHRERHGFDARLDPGWARLHPLATDDRHPLLAMPQVHHLRTHGDFLIVRKGLFRIELLRALGTLALSAVATLMFVAGLLLLVIPILMRLGAWIVGPGLWERPDASTSLLGAAAVFPDGWWHLALGVVLGGAFLGGVLVYLLMGRQLADAQRNDERLEAQRGDGRRAGAPGPPGRSEPVIDMGEQTRARLRWFAFLGLLAPIAAGVVLLALDVNGWREHLGGRGLLLPMFWCLGAAWGGGIVQVLCARMGFMDRWRISARSVVQGATGLALVGAVLSALAYGLALAATWVAWARLSWSPQGLLSGAGALAALAARATAREPISSRTRGGVLMGLAAVGRRLVLLLAVPVFLSACLIVGVSATIGAEVGSVTAGWIQALFGAALFGVTTLWIDYNRVSPHYFYRDRLSEAYLRTVSPRTGGLFRDDARTRLDAHGVVEANATGVWPAVAPYHLIQCAVNLPGSRDLARRNRKSDHFTFSRLYCGSRSTGFVPTSAFDRGYVNVGKAMTLSGAAASSSMGFQTSFTQAFAMTLFNLRLGCWLPNPAYHQGVQGEPAFRPARAWAPARVPLLPAFWARYLMQELFAQSDERLPFVNVSDGGHTGDNLGLYALLQRRCPLIVISDAECDPDLNCGSLAAGIRQIFTDENVELDIDVDPLRTEDRAKREQVVVGRIRYPVVKPDDRRGDLADADWAVEEGYLVYLKALTTGAGEPLTVEAYARTHPAFPHQTTGDQFFDDDQFEAYRRLGEHIATTWLDQVGLRVVPAGALGPAPGVPDALLRWCRARLGLAAPTPIPPVA